MKEVWKTNLDAQGDHVLKTLDRELRYHGIQAKELRKKSDRLRVSTLVLGGASTVVLGLQFNGGLGWLAASNNIALVLGAAITVITGIATFWNIDKYRMQNIAMYLRMKDLRQRFVYEAKRDGGLNEASLGKLYEDLQELKAEKVRYWERALEEVSE